MYAILLGSIGSVVETSEMQRTAFNMAFREHGLNWTWQRDFYQNMLRISGGSGRIATYAAGCGQTVDPIAIHATKTRIFNDLLDESGIELRRGVLSLLAFAKSMGCKTGFITSTELQTVNRIRAGIKVGPGTTFDVFTSRHNGLADKPDPAVYRYALAELGIAPAKAVAIEDNADGIRAAKAAGLVTIAFPGENTMAHDVSQADHIASDDLVAALCNAVDFAMEPVE
ncbi:HAD family phosphatase [Actibacterium sp. 188UL27-1]|uniref:HAD family hydrolase n=1 Tax=Actibacterium sp. 188UL27-1 TaxID=2786961 RepID=UPI0019572DDB|nr:HAD-IA family hydrolase [Actibacterium sp. 188UL27-1]MBM7066751.1 HAD-IA family hydrolase [Actibacterium sp. 188UL27-1]